jgi:voltage-gated potassium channel
MTPETGKTRQVSNSYSIFILLLTILSLAVMVVRLLPLSESTLQLLSIYDTLICVIFLIDFVLNLRGASRKSDYLIRERGWLDLLGSIPSLGITRFGGLLRLARLSRLARIARLLRGENMKALVKDVLDHRSQYAMFITILLTLMVLSVASVLVLQFESQSADAKITTGWDAFWYSIVTITTVGYGDVYPVTTWGRVTAMFIMFAGVGIIGALASILASLLVGSSAPAEGETPPAAAPASDGSTDPSVRDELKAIRDELAVMRHMMERMGGEDRP